MKDSGAPIVFWDYCLECRVRINNLTAKKNSKLHGTTPFTTLTGEQGDIFNLILLDWYDWCYYRDNKESPPFNKEVLGWALGPARGAGNEMAH